MRRFPVALALMIELMVAPKTHCFCDEDEQPQSAKIPGLMLMRQAVAHLLLAF